AVGRGADGRPVTIAAGSDRAATLLAEVVDRAARRWAGGEDVVLVAAADEPGAHLRIDAAWRRVSPPG
ncbi:MAG TPA: hypothetical protein VGB14_10605, partial [Acidimicrobiales bacterium]